MDGGVSGGAAGSHAGSAETQPSPAHTTARPAPPGAAGFAAQMARVDVPTSMPVNRWVKPAATLSAYACDAVALGVGGWVTKILRTNHWCTNT